MFGSRMIIAGIMALAASVWVFAENPIGPTTVPQSSLPNQSGLRPSPRPGFLTPSGGIAGNDIVTGNVGGGKEFRGVVPYGSPSYFQNNQGSAALDNFNRRAAGTGYQNDRSPGSIDPYYAPPRVVTRVQGSTPINSQAYETTPSLRQSGYNTYGLVPLEEAQKLLNPSMPEKTKVPLATEYGINRPLTMTPQEVEQYLGKELVGKLNPAEQQAQLAQFKKELEEVKQQAQELKKKVTDPLRPETPDEMRTDVPGEPTQPLDIPETKKEPGINGVFEEMAKRSRQEFHQNLQTLAEQRAKESPAEVNYPKQEAAGEFNEPEKIRKSFSEIEPGMAKAILGYQKTFAAQSKDRFNELMKAAEVYIKEKKFYKAADAYTVAAAYQSRNPLPYAGKAHALFGAGEYMSSAYFLSRAIEIWPDYTRFKVDIASLFDDKDLLQTRIADITGWQERTGSGELLFLLAYVYYETDQLDKALMSVNGAMVKMPQSKAVQMLDKVIHLAAQQQQQQTSEAGKP